MYVVPFGTDHARLNEHGPYSALTASDKNVANEL